MFVFVARIGTHVYIRGEKAVVSGGEAAFEKGGISQNVRVESGKYPGKVIRVGYHHVVD